MLPVSEIEVTHVVPSRNRLVDHPPDGLFSIYTRGTVSEILPAFQSGTTAHPGSRGGGGAARKDSGGLRYGPDVVGKHQFRVRERHVADHLALLIQGKAPGAAKLDLVLRGVALSPDYSGKRTPGLVLPAYGYSHLFDLTENPDRYGPAVDLLDYPPEAVRAKRKWVGEQLQRLTALKLVKRNDRPGHRPELIVLRDDGSEGTFDDPDGKGQANAYVTITGSIISTGQFRSWGGPELAFYLAAMVAERYSANRLRVLEGVTKPWAAGAGQWFQTLDWFADPDGRRPAGQIRIPFSVPTLERGLRRLVDQGLVERETIRRDPLTGRRFARPRNLYTNKFNSVDEPSDRIDEARLRKLITEFMSSEPGAVTV